MPKHIAVLDFGSQYTQVIARRIREANVLSRIYPYNTQASVLQEAGAQGLILSGGPSSVLVEENIELCRSNFNEWIIKVGVVGSRISWFMPLLIIARFRV